MHVLVLGGTGEARELASALAARPGVRVTLSLAGRTRAPILPACAVRIGGFGGVEGLAEWMRSEDVGTLVDATHPFARVISGNAERAATAAGVPLVVVERPRWEAAPGDRWTRVADMSGAVAALGRKPQRVFLAVGRQEVGAFRAAAQHHYLVRSIEEVAPGEMPPGARAVLARGPFSEADERALLSVRRIEVLVAKNSGSAATYGKIAAARSLGLPVVVVDRPVRAGAAASVGETLQRLDHVGRSAKRGV